MHLCIYAQRCTTSFQLAEYLSIQTTNERITRMHNPKLPILHTNFYYHHPDLIYGKYWRKLSVNVLHSRFNYFKSSIFDQSIHQISRINNIRRDYSTAVSPHPLFLQPPSPFNSHSQTPTLNPNPNPPTWAQNTWNISSHTSNSFNSDVFLTRAPLNWMGNAEASKAFFAPFGFQHDLIYIVSNFRDSAVICF